MKTRKAKRQMKESMIQYSLARIGRVDRVILGCVSVFLGGGGDVMARMEGV